MGSSSFQQKLLLKGSDESIDVFTDVLRKVKDRAGWSTAKAVTEAIECWNLNGTPSAVCRAQERHGRLRPIQLPLLCPASDHMKATDEVEKLKRDNTMTLVMMRGGVGRDEWLLESLVVALELVLSIVQPSGSRYRYHGTDLIIKSGGTNSAESQSGSAGVESNEEVVKKHYTSDLDINNSGARNTNIDKERDKQHKETKKNLDDEDLTKCTNSYETENVDKEERKKLVTVVRHTSSGRVRRVTINSDTETQSLTLSGDSTRKRRKKEKRKLSTNKTSSPPNKKISGLRYDISLIVPPLRTSKERKDGAKEVAQYLSILTPEERVMPGFKGKLAKWDRHKHGVDCDEVYPGIVLGNGATVKKRDYLRSIGITHVLNAAEFRGVNVGEEFYTSEGFEYKGLRLEDTPQTKICRHFMEVAQFLDSALSQENGKIFVNCVFGRSRSTTCIVSYLMLKHGWGALKALKHIRLFRPVEVNEGFLQQLADLDYKLKWYKNRNLKEYDCDATN